MKLGVVQTTVVGEPMKGNCHKREVCLPKSSLVCPCGAEYPRRPVWISLQTGRLVVSMIVIAKYLSNPQPYIGVSINWGSFVVFTIRALLSGVHIMFYCLTLRASLRLERRSWSRIGSASKLPSNLKSCSSHFCNTSPAHTPPTGLGRSWVPLPSFQENSTATLHWHFKGTPSLLGGPGSYNQTTTVLTIQI